MKYKRTNKHIYNNAIAEMSVTLNLNAQSFRINSSVKTPVNIMFR